VKVINGSNFEIYTGSGDDTVMVEELELTNVRKLAVYLGDGNDTLNGANTARNIKAYGESGNDVFIGGSGRDFFDGGEGSDTVDYSTVPMPVKLNLRSRASQDGRGGRDRLKSIENVVGSEYDDLIVGSKDANVIEGLGGDDTVQGGSGDDVIYGGAGDDFISGGKGNDRVVWAEGDGNDTIDGGPKDQDRVEIGTGDGDDSVEVVTVGESTVISRVDNTPFEIIGSDVEAYEIRTGGGGDTLTLFELVLPGVETLFADLGDGDDQLNGAWPLPLPDAEPLTQVTVDGGSDTDTYHGPADPPIDLRNFENEDTGMSQLFAGAEDGKTNGWLRSFLLNFGNSDDEDNPNSGIQVRIDEEGKK